MNIYDTKVEELFGLRTSNALRRNNCHTIRDLLTLGRGKVSLINGIGGIAVIAISCALAARGLSWTDDGCAPPQASRAALLEELPSGAAARDVVAATADYILAHMAHGTAEQVVLMLREEAGRREFVGDDQP
jgi:hypothetical protein